MLCIIWLGNRWMTAIYLTYHNFLSLSQWPRGLRPRSTASRLLLSWVRIPPGKWMFVCCVCCQVQVSATSWSPVQRSPTDCDASLCVIMKRRERDHSPRWAAASHKIIIINNNNHNFSRGVRNRTGLLRASFPFIPTASCTPCFIISTLWQQSNTNITVPPVTQ
jgi:hypothetical protein